MWLIVLIAAFVLIVFLLVLLGKKNSEIGSLSYKLSQQNNNYDKQTKISQEQSNKIASLEKEIESKNKCLSELKTDNEKYALFFELSTLYQDNSSPQKQFLNDIINILKADDFDRTKEIILLKNRIAFLESSQSNLTAIPYMAQIMADYETYGIQHLASELNWGRDVRRLKKVKSINEIREDAREIAEQNREAQYQLAYLLELFPTLQEVLDCEFSQLPIIEVSELSNYDHTLDYLSKEEYDSLSVTDRNQLALDRYVKSRSKTKWQIGRDYELYIGYRFEKKGFKVDYYGSYMGIEDLGRDLIVDDTNGITHIVQCKYWSKEKQIHEKHITQLYGTVACYCFEHNLPKKYVDGIIITNIQLSSTAKKMAKYLGIKYEENVPLGEYPRIKCNLGKDEYGWTTKIYHLPFDQQYDKTKINQSGEFMATTVKEAENAGFRRAYKWHGN